MTPVPGDPTLHFFMTRSVARVMGLNLTDGLSTGALGPSEYARMVTDCRACALVEACAEWLSSGETPRRVPPPGCCNGETLLRLARAMA